MVNTVDLVQLFHGGDSNWQVHLTAASALILSIHGISTIGTSDTGQPQQPSRPAYQRVASRPVSTNSAALAFFTGTIIWFDILACVSTSSIPHLASYHDQFFSSSEAVLSIGEGLSNRLDLQSVMGCQNWAMKIISEIAEIGSWRHNHYPDLSQHIQKAAESAKDIQHRLHRGISRVRAELEELRQQYSGNPPYYFPDTYDRYTKLAVTHNFACAALIYLQTSVTSSPSVFHIQDPLQDVISAMRLIPDPRMVRGMIWPLCVAGCVATSLSDQEFFRSAAKATIKDAGTFGNSCKALEVLEMAWRLQRDEGRLIDCTTCIQRLGTCVLLV